jgi:ABC-type multidrug transport system fused ATPase/permease subunit
MLAFITYALTDHNLDPALIFSSLALFNSLRLPLNLLPLVIGQVIDAWSSMGRIQEYLRAEEIKDDFHWDRDATPAIAVKNAGFTWERTSSQDPEQRPAETKARGNKKDAAKGLQPDDHQNEKHDKAAEKLATPDSSSTVTTEREPFALSGIDFTFKRDELVAVIGTVGSGKTSLLAALAGDMRKTHGEVTMGASRAFCPQYAWIQNATVKENILFGKEYDPAWYAKVIEACALGPDLEMLPNGDQTEIGERGITISGGQKQRLNIARAIYFNADIVLMDDPLSAVDANVGQYLFDHAITGLLQNKCRVLATHQLQVLNRCDRIIWMQDGRIEAFDTYDNLMATNDAFVKMMASTVQEQRSDDEESSDDDHDHDNTDDDLKREKSRQRKAKKKAKPALALMQAEERAVKSVPWSVYGAYVKASGTILNGPLIILLLIISQGTNIATSLWISFWSSDKFGLSMGQYIGIYASLGVAQALMMFIFSVSLTIFGTTASKVMLNRAMGRVLRANVAFFDTTPMGRILNRFSKDVDTTDNQLTDSMRMFFFTMAMILSVFILIIVYFYWFALAVVPLCIAFLFSTGYYRASARELKRHEAVLRSDVYSRFGEALSGTACIRAYGLQNNFIKRLTTALDRMDGAYFLSFANQRWLAIRLDTVGNLLVFATGILVITSRFDVSPSISGLVLSYIISVVQMISFSVRQWSEVESAMNCTERLHYYGTQLEEEAPLHMGNVRPSWPEKGEVVFDNVDLRYRSGLPLVLHGLNMHVRGGEKIGVCGRTGAGKSSIMQALFRIVELSGGSISIDGVDISKIGLHELRSRMAIIPQDPTLFRGTVRSNLDPFSEHTDLELWSALRQSDLVSQDASLDDKTPGRIHLDGLVEEEGLNFSLGQRQLLALARALVRGSQIIVCDEATSSVDIETDRKIQETIAQGFKGKTLLCIAHRLRTIINYDRICVMDGGKIAELDTPLRLFERRGGIFRGMCEKSGIRREDFMENDEAAP